MLSHVRGEHYGLSLLQPARQIQLRMGQETRYRHIFNKIHKLQVAASTR
jgi:hypothetical protein